MPAAAKPTEVIRTTVNTNPNPQTKRTTTQGDETTNAGKFGILLICLHVNSIRRNPFTANVAQKPTLIYYSKLLY
jgi:hypothetical protein